MPRGRSPPGEGVGAGSLEAGGGGMEAAGGRGQDSTAAAPRCPGGAESFQPTGRFPPRQRPSPFPRRWTGGGGGDPTPRPAEASARARRWPRTRRPRGGSGTGGWRSWCWTRGERRTTERTDSEGRPPRCLDPSKGRERSTHPASPGGVRCPRARPDERGSPAARPRLPDRCRAETDRRPHLDRWRRLRRGPAASRRGRVDERHV